MTTDLQLTLERPLQPCGDEPDDFHAWMLWLKQHGHDNNDESDSE